jgi:hypothetical protein
MFCLSRPFNVEKVPIPGNIGGIARDEELLDPEPVGHIVVLPAPAPEQVAEPVYQPDQTEKMDILILFHELINYEAVLRIRIRIRIHVFLGFLDPDPDPLVTGMDPAPDPDPSIIKQK